MMTRWSLFSVVDRVVLIFVEERKEEGTFKKVMTFQSKLLLTIYILLTDTNYNNIKLKVSYSCVYPPPGFSNSGTARYPLDFNA
jgi:hypothetical protein